MAQLVAGLLLLKRTEMQITEKQINKLEEIQARQNDGRGINCIRVMIGFLRKGLLEHARNICFAEFDKFCGCTELVDYLSTLFPEFKEFMGE